MNETLIKKWWFQQYTKTFTKNYLATFISQMLKQKNLRSNLSRGRDEQAEAVYGNIDRNTHAGKSQVTLPHDGLESFIYDLHK